MVALAQAGFCSGGCGPKPRVDTERDNVNMVGVSSCEPDNVLLPDFRAGYNRGGRAAKDRQHDVVVDSIAPGKEPRHYKLFGAGNERHGRGIAGERDGELAVYYQIKSCRSGVAWDDDLVPVEPRRAGQHDRPNVEVGKGLVLVRTAVQQVVLDSVGMSRQEPDQTPIDHVHAARRPDMAQHDADLSGRRRVVPG